MISEADTTAIRAIAERHIEGWPLSGTLRADIERALLAARHQAEEAMRERAAVKVELHPMRIAGQTEQTLRKGFAAAIRSIDTRGE